MKFRFKEIEPDFYKAKLSGIKEESICYGEYLRFIFTITDTEGSLRDYSFSGIVKPTLLNRVNSIDGGPIYSEKNQILTSVLKI